MNKKRELATSLMFDFGFNGDNATVTICEEYFLPKVEQLIESVARDCAAIVRNEYECTCPEAKEGIHEHDCDWVAANAAAFAIEQKYLEGE